MTANQKKLFNEILESLKELGIDECKRYQKEFTREPDFNIVQYGNLLVYYDDVRELFKRCGYKVDRSSDNALWERYKRIVGYIVTNIL